MTTLRGVLHRRDGQGGKLTLQFAARDVDIIPANDTDFELFAAGLELLRDAFD
jgi:hypothetical protein